MERIPEPELMDDPVQAKAYADADFEAPHEAIVTDFCARFPGWRPTGPILDLGCGPADVTVRLARRFPGAIIHGIDGAAAMLAEGRRRVAAAHLGSQVRLFHRRLPQDRLPADRYAAIFSNSLLHHLHDPSVLWRCIAAHAAPGVPVYVADLMRPASRRRIDELVAAHVGAEPEILQRDFRQSLAAAFTPAEVARQVEAAGLTDFAVSPISDRHLAAWRRMTHADL